MRLTRTLSALGIIGCATFPTAGFSAPLISGSLQRHAAHYQVEQVWCRHGYCGDGGASVGGLIGGIVGGAIAAGAANAAAEQQAQAEAQAFANQQAASCARRFRSYDPASGTYLKNGRRLPCP